MKEEEMPPEQEEKAIKNIVSQLLAETGTPPKPEPSEPKSARDREIKEIVKEIMST